MKTALQKGINALALVTAILSGLLCIAVMYATPLAIRLRNLLADVVYLLMGRETPEQIPWEFFAWFLIFAAPAALCVGLLWFALRGSKAAVAAPLACGIALTALSFASLQTDPDTVSNGPLIFAAPVGMLLCTGGIWLYGKLQKACPAVFNRETVSYLVFGVLTTVVSFVSQMLFASLGTPAWLNTIGSWICAVIFAYIVNKLFVFESHTDTAKAFWHELWLFFAARLASLGMELVFMIITVDLLHFSEAVCKLIAQVFILVANYIFSKLVIFKKNK